MLHRRELLRWFTLILVIACPLSLWGAEWEMQDPKTPIARLEVQPTRIDWLPQIDCERLVLTVAGPGELYVQREFGADETPAFTSLDAPAGHLSDGVYAYELRAVSQEPQKAGDSAEMPLVQSGHLLVQGGVFVEKAPTRPDPSHQDRGKPESKPPIRNFTPKDIVQNDDLVVKGHACIGPVCTAVNPGDPGITLKEDLGGLLQIKFDSIGCCFPSTVDWAVQANDHSNVNGDFLIRNLTFSSMPFRIYGATALPDNSLTVGFGGNIGLGTLAPGAPLHLIRSNGTAKALVEETSGTTALRNLFTMKNNGGIQLLWDRTDGSSKDWQASNFNATFEISIPGSSPGQFSLNQNGNLTIGGTQYLTGSSRDLKENFAPVDGRKILQRLVDMPLSSWNAKDDPAQRHIGPVAEDWWGTFGLGPDDKHVSTTDVGGVALAAIKGLHQVVAEKETEIAELRQGNTELRGRVEALEALVGRLTKERETTQADPILSNQN